MLIKSFWLFRAFIPRIALIKMAFNQAKDSVTDILATWREGHRDVMNEHNLTNYP